MGMILYKPAETIYINSRNITHWYKKSLTTKHLLYLPKGTAEYKVNDMDLSECKKALKNGIRFIYKKLYWMDVRDEGKNIKYKGE